jgi:hypothetical protein
MLDKNTNLDAYLARYKLGLDTQTEQHLQFLALWDKPAWQDRLLSYLGDTMIRLGSWMKRHHEVATPAAYQATARAK